MSVCVCLREQEETARVQRRTQGASRVPVMFYFLIWVLAVPLYSPAKVYQATVMIYDIGSIRILHFKKKSILKRERKTCKDSYPWPLKYHASPSKSWLLQHTSTSPCLSILDPTWPLCWAPNTSALQYLYPQYSLHEDIFPASSHWWFKVYLFVLFPPFFHFKIKCHFSYKTFPDPSFHFYPQHKWFGPLSEISSIALYNSIIHCPFLFTSIAASILPLLFCL